MAKRMGVTLQSWGFALSLVFVSPAAAQEEGGGRLEGFIGLGVLSEPTFSGSDEMETGVLPVIDLTWDDRFFVSTDRGVGAYVFGGLDAPLRFGVGVGYDFTERNPDDDDRLTGLEKVEASPALKLFAEYVVGFADVELEVVRAFGGDGHEGTTAELSVGFEAPVGERAFFSVSPFVTWADGKYTDALYGVSAAGAAASGLEAYDAGNGLNQIGVDVTGAYFVTERVSIVGTVEYGRLLGDAADSPVSFDDSQVEVSAGLLFSF